VSADVDLASERLSQATKDLVQITFLPKAIGARVKWPHNGVIWERVSENGWRAPSAFPFDTHSDFDYPSSHIVMCAWEVIQ
jgi:hypothetical protein